MQNILKEIEYKKRLEIIEDQKQCPLFMLRKRLDEAPTPRPFLKALKAQKEKKEFALIAEIKKASPSKGLIRSDFDPVFLARAYAEGGAAALSVLTDTSFFQGKPEDLIKVRQSVKLPVLRKDFIFDPYQVYQSRVWGADCILLILAAVTDEELFSLEETAFQLQMDVLLEVHTEKDMERALTCRSDLIGINNRDLRTFRTDIQTSLHLSSLVPKHKHVISESGLTSHADLLTLSKRGITSFLVGESLMRQKDITQATRSLLGKEAECFT